MDSQAEDASDGKRARLTPSVGDDGGVDLISGLLDDVLLRILGQADARDAARTAALSRRWLRLWPRAPALHFASRPASCAARGAERRAAMEEFASSVNGVLARRAGQSGSAIEALSISYTSDGHANMEELKQASSVSAVGGWIRYAFQLGVKSFLLDLSPYMFEFVVVLDDLLPSPVRLETMRLALGGRSFRFPTTMKFASLADLSLEGISIIGAASAHLLGHLVSSVSCPLLQKLRMRKICVENYYDYEEMRLEADVLSELWMEDVQQLRSLKICTPSLRVFHIYESSHKMLAISAPRLEELAISFRLGRPPKSLEIDGDLPCLQSLKICLRSHRASGHREAEKDANVLLLKHCSLLTCLNVTLQLQGEEDDVELIKTGVPQLPHITSLTVNVSDSYEWHNFGAGVASLLTRFNNLKHLSLHLPFFHNQDCNLPAALDILRDHLDHYCKSKEFSMAHLLELELTGFTGTECELLFMKVVLTTAKRVHKVTISFNPHCCQPQSKMDAFERLLVDEGMWASHREKHILTCLR